MDYQIIQINPSTWRIEDDGVRFFLLTGTEKALLIDSAYTRQYRCFGCGCPGTDKRGSDST